MGLKCEVHSARHFLGVNFWSMDFLGFFISAPFDNPRHLKSGVLLPHPPNPPPHLGLWRPGMRTRTSTAREQDLIVSPCHYATRAIFSFVGQWIYLHDCPLLLLELLFLFILEFIFSLTISCRQSARVVGLPRVTLCNAISTHVNSTSTRRARGDFPVVCLHFCGNEDQQGHKVQEHIVDLIIY